MYESFYGLSERPFDLTPNPRFLLLTKQHEEALSNLEYGISARKGITVLIGDAGTGKTTLIRTAFSRASKGATSPPRWLFLKNPRLQQSEFLEFLATGFELSPAAAVSKTRLLEELEALLVGGLRAALVVDEAQSVPMDLLEEIRLLANIESDTEKLLPVVLAGQPELAARLNDPALSQLKQRVALRCSLAPLTLADTAGYIAGRIRIAGGDPARLFSRDAVMAIHDRSRGIPRTISVICDNALLTGFADEQRPITAETIELVCRDFDLPASPLADKPSAREEAVAPAAARVAGADQGSARKRPAGIRLEDAS